MWQRVGNHKWLATTRLNHEDLESYKFAVECLERIGHRLTAVDSSGFNQGKFTASQALTIFDKVAQLCPKLEELKIEGWNMKAEKPELLARNCPHIRKFCIDDNWKSSLLGNVVDNQVAYIFRNFPNIEFLEISNAPGFMRSSLDRLPTQMKALICRMCDGLVIFDKINPIPVDLKNLKVLHLEGCLRVDCHFLCPSSKLEYLSLKNSFVTNPEDISKFKQLKSLCLDDIEVMNPVVLEEAFVDICRGCVNLEELSIDGPCIGRSALIKSSDGRVVRHKRVQYLRLTLSPDGIACLHKLRFFNFSTVVNAPQVVETLSSSAPFLEHLACRRCEGYLDRPLIKLVQSCKRLTYFNVSGCPKVSAALLMAVNEEVASRTRELTLGVGGCGILEHQLGTIVTSPLLSMSQTYRTVPRMPMTFSESDR